MGTESLEVFLKVTFLCVNKYVGLSCVIFLLSLVLIFMGSKNRYSWTNLTMTCRLRYLVSYTLADPLKVTFTHLNNNNNFSARLHFTLDEIKLQIIGCFASALDLFERRDETNLLIRGCLFTSDLADQLSKLWPFLAAFS